MLQVGRDRTPAVWAYAVLFLFFLQLLTDFVGGIYVFGLLGTSLPPEVATVILFLSPFLLLAARGRLSPRTLHSVAYLTLLCRVVAVFLPPRSAMLANGLGTGLFLIFLPALLWHLGRRRDHGAGPILGAALLLAVALSIMLRSLGATYDLTGQGLFRVVAILLAISGGWLLPRVTNRPPDMESRSIDPSSPASTGRTITLGIGLAGVFLLTYFAFASPAVISRWTGTGYLAILAVIVLALIGFAWLRPPGLRPSGGRLDRRHALALNVAFGLALTLTLVAHHVALPADPAAYPLLQAPAPGWSTIALLAMLLLFPVLFLDFGLLAQELIRNRPSLNQFALAFGLAGLFMLLLILANVFTAVWPYVSTALEPVARGRFWHVHALVALVLLLSLLAVRRQERLDAADTDQGPGLWFAEWPVAWLVTAAGVIALFAAFLLSPRTDLPPAGQPLKVAGYNVHQGYDEDGRRSHHEQCQVLREIDAAVIGLSETDTARIAGGNVDLVRFLAQCLDMHSYYGPKTAAGSFGYALLSRYPIRRAETYHLYSGPGLPSVRRPDRQTSGDVVAVIKAELLVDGRSYTVFVNHFDSFPPREQPQGLVDLAAGLPAVITTGDFNCEPGTECFELMTRVLNPCGDPAVLAGRIDHILVSPDLACADFAYVESDASDHPAVTAVIR
jgi:endonuclease/exonuclease/phosphatase family metal-dependent hydrolase